MSIWRKGLCFDRISNRAVAFRPALVHPRQHRNTTIYVVVDLHESFVVVETVQPAHVLLERALPGDRHRQEERIQTRVVKTFAYVAPRRQNYPGFFLRHGRQGRPARSCISRKWASTVSGAFANLGCGSRKLAFYWWTVGWATRIARWIRRAKKVGLGFRLTNLQPGICHVGQLSASRIQPAKAA